MVVASWTTCGTSPHLSPHLASLHSMPATSQIMLGAASLHAVEGNTGGSEQPAVPAVR